MSFEIPRASTTSELRTNDVMQPHHHVPHSLPSHINGDEHRGAFYLFTGLVPDKKNLYVAGPVTLLDFIHDH
jgi:hypothetical protein